MYEIGRIDAEPQGADDTAPTDHPASVNHTMTREEWSEMRFNCDRSRARTASTVWNTKRLVEVDVRDVGAVIARSGKANMGIQICSVEIDLTPAAVDDFADFANLLLKDPVG